MPSKRKPRPPTKLPARNLAAKNARDQKAGAMKDRREPRKGARNVLRDALDAWGIGVALSGQVTPRRHAKQRGGVCDRWASCRRAADERSRVRSGGTNP